MNQEYIKRLLSEEGLRHEYRKPFRFGNGVLATNRFIMAVSESDAGVSEYGESAALEPAARMLRSLPSIESRATLDINLLKQAVEIFDNHRVVNLNLYQKGSGMHYIEIASGEGEAVLFCGMYPTGADADPFPTIAERFALVNPTFNDCGAGI